MMRPPAPPKARNARVARQNGYAARVAGFQRNENPHSAREDCMLFAAWNDGWDQRAREEKAAWPAPEPAP